MADLAARAAALQVRAYPLIFAQRMRLNLTQPLDPYGPRPETSAGAPVGVLGHQRSLAAPSLAVAVAPNVDTLYSSAWLALDVGAYEASLADPGERYLSLQVGCADTSSPTVRIRRGPRAVSEEGGVVQVSTPERWAMMVGRTGVDPYVADDVADAHALQNRIGLTRDPAEGSGPALEPRAVDRRIAELSRQDEILEPRAFATALSAVLADLGPGQVPGPANWLPAPDGPLRLMLRLYWPEGAEVWEPPYVVREVAR